MKKFTAMLPPNSSFACLVASTLDVLCEEDLLAKKHGDGANGGTNSKDFALDLFRKIVLPKLKEEVNEGEHFSEIRKIYSAEILATWLKKNQQQIKSETIRKLVNSGDTSLRLAVNSITPIRPEGQAAQESVVAMKDETKVIEHATPNASAFKVPENVEFYEQYIRLFKNGVFRCARSEPGDTPEERVIRVYFSGAIDFRNLADVIKCLRL
jgi:hypothetical protein